MRCACLGCASSASHKKTTFRSRRTTSPIFVKHDLCLGMTVQQWTECALRFDA